MKTSLTLMIYFTDNEIKKEFGQIFNAVKDKPYDAIDAILKTMASQQNVEDFVFNYYTEGDIFKKLKTAGSVAYFMVKNIEHYQALEALVTKENISNILKGFMSVASIKSTTDEKPSIVDLRQHLSSFTLRFLLEQKLDEKPIVRQNKI